MSRKYAPLEKNLLEVRRALGKLIIVGDQIEFKQRIQVDASAVNPEVQLAPLLLNIVPIATSGTYNVTVQNGPTGRPSNPLPLTVN